MGAHAFVLSLDEPALDEGDRRHLGRVLRLRHGEEMTVSDGAGAWRRCRFGPTLEPLGAIRRQPRPEPPVSVAFALVKGDNAALVVQKLTELGVDVMVPFAAARSVVRWNAEKGAAALTRLRRVAREAAMQSRRVWLPEIAPLETFVRAAARPGAVIAHPDGQAPSLSHRVVLVGPEGGWDDGELACGLDRVRLGAHVLRSETAAVAAGTIMCSLRAGIVAEKAESSTERR